MQYLKDTFIVQGVLSSSKRFLIVTEATLYIYESQDQYFKGKTPEEILNLLQYEVQNHKDSVLLLKDLKNQEKMLAFYSPSQDQIKIWYSALIDSQQQYGSFMQSVADQKQKIVPFDEMNLIYSLDQIILKTN